MRGFQRRLLMKLSKDEFERLALEHMDMLFRIARRLSGSDAASAEDLVQETYLRAFRALDKFELNEQYGIKPWLLRIMHNLHFSRAGREKRQPTSIDDEHLASIPDSAGGSGGLMGGKGGLDMPPLALGSFEGMDERLVRAIDDLPPEYQTVLLLWAVDELSYKEIATALDVPIGTVMSRLHRARQRLAEQLQDFAREERIVRE
jgi:RNA polymerase sigma-70 factor (ECF subfamily)